jgi:serine/threonine-protein kinase HipA
MKADRFDVCIEWAGATHAVGILFAAEHGQSVVFEYLPDWLARDDAFAIDPTALPLGSGPFHSPRLFGAFADAGPDRWGRILIERSVRHRLLDRRPYRDIDYVLAIDDIARIGALRFRRAQESAFQGTGRGSIPPLVRLRELLAATEAVHADTATARDLQFLLGAGSPLGGARPKCLVQLVDGKLAIAKFPKPDDTRDVPAGEVLGLAVARAAGIHTADHELVRVADRSVAVITRFDRHGVGRIPFISAASLLGIGGDEPGSYTRLADAIRVHGDDVAADLAELWRRLVFSLLANNYDDHMRNHGFLMRRAGAWALSPAYDLNPTPAIDRSRQPKTPVSEDSPGAAEQGDAVAEALSCANRFGLDGKAARAILADVTAAIRRWRSIGRELGIKAAVLDLYADCFEAE